MLDGTLLSLSLSEGVTKLYHWIAHKYNWCFLEECEVDDGRER
jgi:hypothetical protein